MGFVVALLVATSAVAQPAPNSREALAAQSDKAEQIRRRGIELAMAAVAQTGQVQAATQTLALAQLRRADGLYAAAAEGYRAYFAAHPDDPPSSQLHRDFAQALYRTRHQDSAARVYADVAAATADPRSRTVAAFLAVRSQESWIRSQAQTGALDACTAVRAGIPAGELTDPAGARLLTDEQVTACSAPPMAGTAAREVAIPEPVQTLIDLRDAYVQQVPAPFDERTTFAGIDLPDADRPESQPPFRSKFAYLNARSMLRFGRLGRAEAEYRSVQSIYCFDSLVAEAARDDLMNIEVWRHGQERLGLLARELSERCPPSRPSLLELQADWLRRRNPFPRAEHGPPAEETALYEQAAREMQAAVDSNPRHAQAPLATYYIAIAFERAGRYDTAAQTYQRVLRDYDNTLDSAGRRLTGEDLTHRINILEASAFRAAQYLERLSNHDGAIRLYRRVASDPRFATVADHASHVRDARASIARIHTMQVRSVAAPTQAPTHPDGR